MRITIAGYGYVGRYLESLFESQHEIVMYDPPLGLGAASDLVDTDFVLISVPTPPSPNGHADVSAVEEVVAMAEPRVAIVCESTVPIGTTERLIAETGKRIVFVPEYIGETPDHPYVEPEGHAFVIYGGYEPAVSRVRDLYAQAYPEGTQHLLTTPSTAELAKYMENAFLAMKVAFCNEFFDLCTAAGVDYEQARELWLQDWRIGPSHTRVTGERGYGGKCLPKDVAAIINSGRDLGASMEIMEAVQRANARHRGERPD